MWCPSTILVLSSAALCFASENADIFKRDVKSVLSGAKWSSSTTIGFSGSSTFAAGTTRWSVFDPPTYSAVISPATEADTAQAVKLAVANSIPFLATGGRHGYTTTLGALDNGLAIDLSKFNTVSINKAKETMTIGGAVRFRDIYDPVFNAGFELQMGTCSCPGVVGVTLGAGLGPWGGVHGLIIDALISLRVVTAAGNIIDVSEDCNADLFWAFRGAGANFGIVISATYKLQKQINKGISTVADLVFTPEQNASYFKLVASYEGKLPKELAITSFVSLSPTTGQPQISGSWAYIGPEADARKAFAPVLALNPVAVNIANYPWNKVIPSVGGGSDAFFCTENKRYSVYNANFRKLSASTYSSVFQKAVNFYKYNPDAPETSVQISVFPNQGVLATPDAATAYPWRDALGFGGIHFTLNTANATLAKVAGALGVEIRSDFAATSGYPTLSTYINYAHGDETLAQKYGATKLARLTSLKKLWDPKNAFRFNNALTPI